ncbi:hypothetical protein ACHAPX_001773 [Trichoderma viride]|jgi:hypothetical protein
MTEGRPGAAILTGSALVAVVPLQFRPPGLVFTLESSPGRSDAGKSDPVVEFGEKCTDGGGLVCGRGERKKKRSQDRGPETRLADAEETRRANGVLGKHETAKRSGLEGTRAWDISRGGWPAGGAVGEDARQDALA